MHLDENIIVDLWGKTWQLCAALNVNKKSVDRDLDVYRNLLSKLVQAKELLKEYVERLELFLGSILFDILSLNYFLKLFSCIFL